MGGFAVTVDWTAEPPAGPFDAMASAMAHRARAGVNTTGDGTTLLAEARLARDGHLRCSRAGLPT